MKKRWRKIIWKFHGSWFSNLEFPSCATQFCRISRGENLFSLEFPGVKVFREVYPQTPCLDFFWNSSLCSIDIVIHTRCYLPHFTSTITRSSRQEVFGRKGVLRHFPSAIVSFLINLQAWGILAQVLCCEFSDISKNVFFYRTPPVTASV